MAELGRELINPLALADVRFVTHYGLKLDIAMSPKSAMSGLVYSDRDSLPPGLIHVRASRLRPLPQRDFAWLPSTMFRPVIGTGVDDARAMS
jgi:hypothetical protein